MRAFVAFIWTEQKEAEGFWVRSLIKTEVIAMATKIAEKNNYELIRLHNHLGDIKQFRKTQTNKNLTDVLDKFIEHAD